MNIPSTKNTQFTELRRNAEMQLMANARRKNIAEGAEAENMLLHELEVQKIELEMQNEELRRSRAEIEAGLDRLTDFYDYSPVGYFTLSHDGAIRESNLAGASLIGLERSKLVGRNFAHYVTAEYRPAFTNFLSRVFKGIGKQSCEMVLQRRIGAPPLYVNVSAINKRSDQGCILVVNDITERSLLIKALLEKDYLLSESQRIARIGSWSLAVDGETVRWSDETYRIYGVTPDAFVPTVKNQIGMAHSMDQSAMDEWICACIDGKQPDELEFRTVRPDGSIRTLCVRGELQYAPDGTPHRIIGTVQDITERKKIENALFESEELFRTITESVGDLIAMLDVNGRRIYNNPAYRMTFGDEEPKTGSDAFKEIHPDDRDRIKVIFFNTVTTGVGERSVFRFLRNDGSIRYIESEGNVVHDASGKVSKVIVVSRDVTERKQSEAQMEHFANYDMLTDLPNRRLFSDRLQHALAAAKRDDTKLAVLFLDLDMFKPINDTLGHNIGDLLLKEAASRILHCLRESDSAARMGGDEFVIMLPSTESVHDALVVADKIRDSIGQPYDLDGHSLAITSSIGIAVYPENGSTDEELLRNADTAMYNAKESGRNTVKLSKMEMQNNEK